MGKEIFSTGNGGFLFPSEHSRSSCYDTRMDKSYDVVGIGNPLLDLTFFVTDDELSELGYKKGSMTLVDENESGRILLTLGEKTPAISPGGSASNVLAGVGMLGGRAVFLGSVGNDKHAETYEQETVRAGVLPRLSRIIDRTTGHSIALITPDGERTFATHLGASSYTPPSSQTKEDIARSRIAHFEGYQIDDRLQRADLVFQMKEAQKHDTLVSLDLNDAGVVARNKETIEQIIREFVDIVFANEDEARALTERDPDEAVVKIGAIAPVAVVKRGSGGSYLQSGGNLYKVPAYPARVKNTNGAGDSYAGGFLFSVARNLSHGFGAHIGSYSASRVVEEDGARLSAEGQSAVRDFIKNLS